MTEAEGGEIGLGIGKILRFTSPFIATGISFVLEPIATTNTPSANASSVPVCPRRGMQYFFFNQLRQNALVTARVQFSDQREHRGL